MRVVRLSLTNWLRFAGEHEIDLTGDVYGIVAEHEGDPLRSNWCGKTSLVEAVRFALYGAHRHAREDDWITTGAEGGRVAVALSTGHVIDRSRRRGQATKLRVEHGGAVAVGEPAQEQIVDAVGLSLDDFDVTCWFGQKQLARLVLAKPVDRFGLVSSWFRLEPLQRCEDRARRALALIGQQIDNHEVQRAAADLARGRFLRELGIETTGDVRALVAERVAEAESAVATARRALALATAAAEEGAARKRSAEAAAELAEIKAEGAALSTRIADLESGADGRTAAAQMHASAKAAMTDAAVNLKGKRLLARGQFDGVCPVDQSTCPARDAINARTAENAAFYATAVREYDRLCQAESVARRDADAAQSLTRELDRLTATRESLRGRARRLAPLARDARPDDTDHGALAAAVAEAHRALATAEAARNALTTALSRLTDTDAALAEHDAAIARLRAKESTARAGLRIFGRQGAQRRIAEGALAEIEAGANLILSAAGIDLTVGVQWGREGQGLASWCSECGAPFPASARVRTCEKCSATRGPKIVERLDVELSDRSGAAEDLAGAAIQLAATAWLRRERGVSWAVAFLDEPFGALDEAHRRAFAGQLVAMLRGAAFEQAFVVAHHPDVIDGLPARLLVRAGPESSRVAS
jgi:DNA repair exonuclease SbcCD ATPase subunit